MLGMVIMVIGAGTAVLPLSGLGFETGPFSVKLVGIPALSASLIFVGAVIFSSGLSTFVMLVKR